MKMFKKRNEESLPPAPNCPTNKQMLEDITAADFSDPVFLEGSSKKVFEEQTELDIKYESIKDLIAAKIQLNDLIKHTEEKLSSLQSSRNELLQMTENIKHKAEEALKK